MRKITHVQQYTPTACVPACLEMACFGKKNQKMIHIQMKAYNCSSSWLDTQHQLVRLGLYGELSVGGLTPNKIQLVTVPSLNIKAGNHQILVDLRYLDGSEGVVFDPNKGIEGKNFYEDTNDLVGFSEVTIIHYVFNQDLLVPYQDKIQIKVNDETSTD